MKRRVDKRPIPFIFKVIDFERNMVVEIGNSIFSIGKRSIIYQQLNRLIDDCRQREKDDDEIIDNDIEYCNQILRNVMNSESTIAQIGNTRSFVYKLEKNRCNINTHGKWMPTRTWCYKK